MKKRFEHILSKNKKRNGLILILLTILLIAGCQTTSESKPAMYIEHAQLSKEEGHLLNLMPSDGILWAYDFMLDKTIQIYQVNVYELIDGTWKLMQTEASDFTGRKSRLLLRFEDIEKGISYAMESENDYSSSISPSVSANAEETKPTARETKGFGDNALEIIPDKEIPLLIQVVEPGSNDSFPGAKAYYSPKQFSDLNYDHIYAVTIMFSQKSIEEYVAPSVSANHNTITSGDTENASLLKAVEKQKPILHTALLTLNEFIIAYFTEDAENLIPFFADSYDIKRIYIYPYGETFADVSELSVGTVHCTIPGTSEEFPEWSFLGASSAIKTEYENLLINAVDIPIPDYDIEDGYRLIFSIALKPTPYNGIDLDYTEYLTVEMIWQNGEWKVQGYGLEL